MNVPDLRRIGFAAAVWYALIVAGCALSPAPRGDLVEAQAALAAAADSGAGTAAPEDLARARVKLDLGKRYLADNDYKPARWLFQQAEADAQLAAMKSAALAARYEAMRQAHRTSPRGAR